MPDAPHDSPARALNVITHFMKGDEELHLGLKIRLTTEWDAMSVREAIIEPFVAEYDLRHPEFPASSFQPFTYVKVLIWAGPRPSAADLFQDRTRDGIEDILQAEKPIFALLNVTERVALLRNRAHNKLKPTVELELVAAESTAIVLRSFPTTALLAPGERLMTMLTDIDSDPEDMHALVDSAIAGGELAYLVTPTFHPFENNPDSIRVLTLFRPFMAGSDNSTRQRWKKCIASCSYSW